MTDAEIEAAILAECRAKYGESKVEVRAGTLFYNVYNAYTDYGDGWVNAGHLADLVRARSAAEPFNA